jgi:hypothetical protein
VLLKLVSEQRLCMLPWTVHPFLIILCPDPIVNTCTKVFFLISFLRTHQLFFRVGSVCVGEAGVKAEIMYASMDCASFFDPIMPGSNCQYLYTNVEDCCPDKICNTQLEQRAKCELGFYKVESIEIGYILYCHHLLNDRFFLLHGTLGICTL